MESKPTGLIPTDGAGLRVAKRGGATAWEFDAAAVRGTNWRSRKGRIFFRYVAQEHGEPRLEVIFRGWDEFFDEPLSNYTGFTQP